MYNLILEARFNSQAVGAMNPRTPHYYCRRRKRGNSTSIDFLSDDLLSEILVRVPAEDIHENARIVCRRWKRIIDGDGFVDAHFCRNTCSGLVIVSKRMIEDDFACAHFRLDRSGLLIAKFSEEKYPPLVTEAQSRIQISRLRYKFNFPVLASCNGLILGKETKKSRCYFVDPVTKPFIVNPATRRRFNLPHFAGRLDGSEFCKFALAYAVSTAEYKVVVTWSGFSFDSSAVAWCAILTVGVDKSWRQVPMEQLPDLATLLFYRTPIVTEGFIHWAQEEDVLSMNVETEAITHTRTPLPPQDNLYERRYCHYLTAGKYLSLLISYRDNDLFEIWEMKPDSGEWRKLVDEIDLKSRMGKLRQLWCYCIVPVGWVKYPDAFAFYGNGKGACCIIYNLKNDEFNCFGVSDPDSFHQLHSAVVHRSSLVWLS